MELGQFFLLGLDFGVLIVDFRAVILLGDAPYYGRFGFSARKTGELALPGTFEPERLLALELDEGALDGAWGMVVPTGAPATRPARVRKTARLVPRVA